MNKRTKKMTLGISLLLLLCMSYLILVSKDKSLDNKTESSDTENKGSTKLADFKSDSVTSISFNGINLTLKDSQWIYADNEDYPVDNDKAASLANSLANLSYTNSIKRSETEDLSVYGFEQVSDDTSSDDSTSSENSDYKNLTLKICFNAGGTSHTCYIGAYNSIVREYYMIFDNDDYIYMISSYIADAFDYESIYDLLVVDTIPEIDAAYMTGMAIVTPETDYTFLSEITENADDNTSTVVWYMQTTDIVSEVTKERSATDTEKFSTAVNDIITASSIKAVAYKPSAETLTAYGLTIPEYTIIITYTNESNIAEEMTFTLSIGGSDEAGNLYAIINNSNMVVTIPDIDLDSILS